MNKITIIGTQPPCPRCELLSKVIKAKIKELNIKAEVRHWSYAYNERWAPATLFQSGH